MLGSVKDFFSILFTRKILIPAFLILFKPGFSTTYYWIWNQAPANTTASWTDVGGSNLLHLSTSSGGAANVPSTTLIGSTDNIIFDNNSTPGPAVITSYTIVVDVSPRLDIHDFDASAYTGVNGKGRITFKVPSSSGLQLFGKLDLPHYNAIDPIKNKYVIEMSGDGNLTFSTPASQVVENFTNFSKISFKTILFRNDGIVKFNDSTFFDGTYLTTTYNHIIDFQPNSSSSAAELHFKDYIKHTTPYSFPFLPNFKVYSGKLYLYKNYYSNGTFIVGADYSIPSNNIFVKTNLSSDSASFNNEINLQQFSFVKGQVDLANTSLLNTVWIANQPASGSVLRTTARTKFTYSSFLSSYLISFSSQGYDYHGIYLFNGIAQQITLGDDNFFDSLLINCDAKIKASSPMSPQIMGGACLKLYPGHTFDFSVPDYNNSSTSNSYVFDIAGAFIGGDNNSCSNKPTVVTNGNFNFISGYSVDFNQVQLYFTKGSPVVNINANNFDLGGNIGWTYGGSAVAIPYAGSSARTLYWNQATTSSLNSDWFDANNWSTVSHSGPFGACPPIFVDNVIFPNNAYVTISSTLAQCRNMTWTGTGVLANSVTTLLDTISILEIFGSLDIANALTNNFDRNIRFRGWTPCTIRTSGTKFNRGVIFVGINISNNPSPQINPGSWTLLDDLNCYSGTLSAFSTPPNGPGSIKVSSVTTCAFGTDQIPGIYNINDKPYTFGWASFNLILRAGTLNTNDKTVNTYKFYSIETDFDAYRKLILGSSEINLFGGKINGNSVGDGLAWATYDQSGRFTIDPGTSHIKFHNTAYMLVNNSQPTISPRSSSVGLNFYDVSFLNSENTFGNVPSSGITNSYNDNFHRVNWYSANIGFEKQYTLSSKDTAQSFYFIPYSSGESGLRKINGLVVDTLYYNDGVNSSIIGNAIVNKYLRLGVGTVNTISGGSGYSLAHGTSCAEIEAKGECSNPIQIVGGKIFNDPCNIYDLKDVLVIDDTLSVPQAFSNTVILSGNTVNWNVPVPAARTLYFVGSAAQHGGIWADKDNWSLTSGGTTGECIPICGDSVIFDSNSFTSPTDSVRISDNSSVYCGTMLWKTGATGVFYGSRSSKITICASLIFNTTFTNKFFGEMIFTASSQPNSIITSAGKNFIGPMFFKAQNSSIGNWVLQDNYTNIYNGANSSDYTLSLLSGTLFTNNKNITTTNICMRSNLYRSLRMGKSLFKLTGYGLYSPAVWLIEGDYTKMNLDADSSEIHIYNLSNELSIFANWGYKEGNDPIYLGYYFPDFNSNASNGKVGFRFNKIIVDAGSTEFYLRADTVNEVSVIQARSGGFNLCTAQNSFVNKLDIQTNVPSAKIGFNGTSLSPAGVDKHYRVNNLYIDTLLLNTSTDMYVDTLYVNKKWYFAPGKNYRWGEGSFTWLANAAEMNAIGTSTDFITFDAFNSDIQLLLSNGSSYDPNEGFLRKDSGIVCTDYIHVYNLWATGNGGTYNVPGNSLQSTSDTMLSSSLLPTIPLSGRAKFLGGSNADIQTNAKGWDTSPYGNVPDVTIVSDKDTICLGDSARITVSVINPASKDFPIIVFYKENGVDKSKVIASAADNPFAFYITPLTDSTAIELVSISVNKCFNNAKALNGLVEIFVSRPPDNLILSASPNDTVCVSTSVTINASSSPTNSGGAAVNYYVYSSSSGPSIGTLPYTFTALKDTAFWVSAVNAKGCVSARELVHITVLTATLNATPLFQTICSGFNAMINIAGASGATFAWTSVSPGAVVGNTPVGTGNINDILVNNGSALDTVEYTITPTNQMCVGTPIKVKVVVAPSPTTVGAVNDTVKVPSYQNIILGNASSNDGNTNPSQLGYSVISGPVNGTINMNPDGTYSYTPNLQANYRDSVVYRVCDTCSQTHCKIATIYFDVFVQEIEFPNVYTPNSDGKNDALVFKGLEFYTDNRLIVFNRWGAIVFDAANYHNSWRGINNNNEPVSDGVYYYTLYVKLLDKNFEGFVHIIK